MKSGKTVKPKLVSARSIIKKSWFEIFEAEFEFPNGKRAVYDIPVYSDIVAMLPVSGKEVYLVNEWRPSWGKEVLEIPAGMCVYKDEKGRLKQARDELREEIGLDAKKIRKLGVMMLSGRSKCRVHLYLATELFKSEKKPDDHEHIQVVKMPLEKAMRIFLGGKKETTTFTMAAFTFLKFGIGQAKRV